VKGDRISPNTFGSTPTSENNYGSAINLLVIEGARSIAIFSENAAFPKSARVSAVQAANDYGLNVLMDKIVISACGPVGGASPSVLTNSMLL
jgi:ABC-type branched-subunit amino acid transport system substrate-binding protein